MNTGEPRCDCLVLSRGQWNQAATKAGIEAAMEKFYEWYDHNVSAGEFKAGSRLSTEVALVSKSGIATDGPFGEAKEVIGGCWIIIACSLRKVAEIAAQNPLTTFGLHCEIRPLDPERGTFQNTINERPRS